jgi:hypothetical protein
MKFNPISRALLACVLMIPAAPTFAQSWSSLGTGITGSSTASVFAIAHDTAQHRMIFGGKFNAAGDTTARNLAAWDLVTETWSPIGLGTDNPVRSILIDSTDIYYGGDFTTIDGLPSSVGIAKWNGSFYTSLGSGFFKTGLHAPVASVNAIAIYKGVLYAAGVFDEADGAACMYIAKWEGGWKSLGAGINIGVFGVYDMEVYDGYLYVAGDFDGTTGTVCKNILRWDGSAWSAVGSGTNNNIYSLAVYDGMLYAGGSFTTAGGSGAQRIARWDGSTWSSFGGFNADVNSMCVMGGKLYVSGLFTEVAGASCQRFAIFDASTGMWTPITSGLDRYASALATDGGNVFAGGSFTTAGGNPASRAAVFSTAVGIEDPAVSSDGVNVWPQPSQGRVQISWEGQTSFGLELMDVTGRTWSMGQVTDGQPLDLGNLPKGIYKARLTSGQGEVKGCNLLLQ